jgi:DNA modification methylase
VFYARNPRKNDAAVDRMVASIREFGFKVPVLVRSSGDVVDGHLRLKAARKMGMTEIPVILCDEWTEAQVKAFRLLVNRSVTWADWDEDLLKLEIADLRALDFDLSLSGFDPPEIEFFLKDPAADEEANQVPPIPTVVVTRPGDLWLLGPHRALCGDSTAPEHVAHLLGDRKPRLMVTDPPYGVDYDAAWRSEVDGGDRHATGKVTNDDRIDWTLAYALFQGDVVYIWHAGVHAAEVARGIRACGFEIRTQIIWRKQHFVFSRGAYHWQHEPCWYAVRTGKSSNWRGDRSQSTIWDVPNANPHGGKGQSEQTGHSTQKPIEIMRRPILNHTGIGDGVYDCFLGSGTTLIAAEMTQRVCYGLELEPAYCDVVIQRWQTITSREATLDGDGRTFAQVQEERRAAAADSSSNEEVEQTP